MRLERRIIGDFYKLENFNYKPQGATPYLSEMMVDICKISSNSILNMGCH
jgi:hypothetical protein